MVHHLLQDHNLLGPFCYQQLTCKYTKGPLNLFPNLFMPVTLVVNNFEKYYRNNYVSYKYVNFLHEISFNAWKLV